MMTCWHILYLFLVYLQLLIAFRTETLTISLTAPWSSWLCVLFHVANNITSLILISQMCPGYKAKKKKQHKKSSADDVVQFTTHETFSIIKCLANRPQCQRLCFSHGIYNFMTWLAFGRGYFPFTVTLLRWNSVQKQILLISRFL